MSDVRKIIVFDIDGTLANNDHRRIFVEGEKKDWGKYNELMAFDGVHCDIASLLHWFKKFRYSDGGIILCTGREAKFHDVTMEWLKMAGISDDIFEIHYRKDGDYRSDDIIKVEMLEKIWSMYGKPFLWFDDRDKVVKAIREKGVRVLQVAPGKF